jgi:hypothetical protein
MNQEPLEITLLVIAAFDQLGISYLIGGSLASSIYGEPRFTRDADVLADIRKEHVQPLCEMLEGDFNIAKEAIESAIRYKTSFNVIHYESLFKIDVFLPKMRRFEEQEFKRRALRVVTHDPEKSAYVASAEDVILAKLDWYRQGNEVSDQQWRDVTGIFKANEGSLDFEYLRQSAEELGIDYLLQRLIPEA